MMLFSQKITLFLALGLLVITICIPYALYLSRSDVTGIGVGVMIVAILVAVAAITLDRLAVRVMAPGWLSALELVLLLAVGGWYSYTNRSRILDLSANPSPYFIVIWARSPVSTPVFRYRFPFDSVAVMPVGTVTQLDERTFSTTTVAVPTHWKSYFSRGIDLTHPRYASAYFYGAEAWMNKSDEVDSLLQQAISQQPNH